MSQQDQPYPEQPYPGQPYPQQPYPGGYQPYPDQAPAGYPPYGAPAVPPGTYLDQASGAVIPNGTTLASAGRRIGAWFLGVLLLIVTLFIGYAIWSFVLYGQGQSPKFKLLGMRCCRADNGQVAGWGEMALRELVGCFVLDRILAPITWIISLILVLTRGDRKAIPDLIGGTVVVYDPDKVLAGQTS